MLSFPPASFAASTSPSQASSIGAPESSDRMRSSEKRFESGEVLGKLLKKDQILLHLVLMTAGHKYHSVGAR